MNSSKKAAVAHAVGGKTARACDSCIKKRARWYCAADDAFLCQSCDSSVHSANQLARRHERVLLKTASSMLKPTNNKVVEKSENSATAPSWHRGFTRKARTPRHGKTAVTKSQQGVRNRFPQVPEVEADENNSYDEETEEDQQLLYRVPIYDPFISELCTNSNEDGVANYESNTAVSKFSSPLGNCSSGHDGFLLPSDMDLAEFAADVDSLLGRGLDDDECFGMEGLGLMDCKEKESDTRVKVEEEEGGGSGGGGDFLGCETADVDLMREPFVLNFEDYDDSLGSCGEEDDKLRMRIMMKSSSSSGVCQEVDEKEEEDVKNRGKKMKMFLRLDYEAVITAWDCERSPWTTGDRPNVECLPDCMGGRGGELHFPYGNLNGLGIHPALVDGGREARVSRYREKRRTRLFSKKIRYEVRKLNAEKRPRMKGRFVKRTSFAGTSTFSVLSQ